MYFIIGIIAIFKWLINIIKCFFIGLFNVIIFFPKYFVIGLLSIFGKRKNKKQSKYNRKVSMAMIFLSLSVYFICVFLTSRWYVQGLKIKYLSNSIIDSTNIIEEDDNFNNDNAIEEPDQDLENNNDNNSNNNNNNNNNNNSTPVYYPNDYWDYLSVPFMDVNFNELLNKNPDTVGWIKVEGTKVNYPVVQSTDNTYYLSHAFDRSNNIGGWIFADYRVDFEEFGKNTIIYGHNMNNKTMFGSIPWILNDSYLKNSNNYFIKISTPTTNTVWKVFSAYTIEPEVYYLRTNFSSEPYDKFLNTIKRRSIYNFGVDIGTDDKILTLSTCDNTGTKRVAIHAKMINIKDEEWLQIKKEMLLVICKFFLGD